MEIDSFALPVIKEMPATVPGSVQTDLYRAGVIEDWNQHLNFFNLEWIEHREWVYEKNFHMTREPGKRYILCFDGLDFHGVVLFNQQEILRFDQMHLAHEVDITDRLNDDGHNNLKVVFFQPPEIDAQLGYTSRINVLKARFNYGWDWMPRLVNIGIFRDVYIKAIDVGRILDFYPKACWDGKRAQLEASLQLHGYGHREARVRYEVRYQGEICAFGETPVLMSDGITDSRYTIEIDHPKIWHPNGMGKQPVYTVSATLLDENGRPQDACEKQVGFRTIEYSRTKGAPAGSLPYAIQINGHSVMIKGANWVPISPFFGTVTEEDYRFYLGRLKRMNVNLLRVWGGALLESETFYNLCDEFGIMVWQEFPQSSAGLDNEPCEEKAFIAALSEVARNYILQRRHHVSLSVWCGGNELYWAEFRPVNHSSENIAMLERITAELDPERLFLPASPSGEYAGMAEIGEPEGICRGDVHGPWEYLGPETHYIQFDADHSMLHSEVGTAACPREETLRRYCDGDLWPPTEETPFWRSRGSWWLSFDQLTGLFGVFEENERGLSEYVKAFRYMQMESLRYSVGSIRRKGSAKAGVIIWMANEPFPNSANTSLMEYDGCPKPAFYKLQNLFASTALGLSYASPHIDSDGIIPVTLFACSDSPAVICNVSLEAFDLNGMELCRFDAGEVSVDGAVDVMGRDIPVNGSLALVRITGTSDKALCEEYIFTAGGTAFGALLDAEIPVLHTSRMNETDFRIKNEGNVIALCVECIGIGKDNRPLAVENGYRCILPGESITARTDVPCARLEVNCINSGGSEAVRRPVYEMA